MQQDKIMVELLAELEYNEPNPDISFKIVCAAEDIIVNNLYDELGQKAMHKYLRLSSRSEFLMSLNEADILNRWAETTYKFIRHGNYTLLQLFRDRCEELTLQTLFTDLTGDDKADWTYKQIDWKTKEIASSFFSVESSPRVSIVSENSLDSACCDLACLMYDIFDTPLNVHFTDEIFEYIFNLLKINIVVVDSESRLNSLLKLREKCVSKYKIFYLGEYLEEEYADLFYLSSYPKRFNSKEIDQILEQRKPFSINEVATTMFTSGSTGMPKGVSFSIYNLITKRYARSAAVPFVGGGEVQLCYLPLFHTFGRFLELLGSIYWRGTYVFAGNPSSHTLLNIFPKISPSVFISVPVRWVQLYEKCVEVTANDNDEEVIRLKIREIIGNNLRWGLSAAGWLDPKIFKFFQRNGVHLCSGFGMTEATGGITMTPPGDYKDNSTGKPLPGVELKFGNNNELFIKGHYIARYLDDKGPGDIIPYPDEDGGDYWLATGDVFQKDESGHYQIVDRIKDIYKNSKGQTVAPRIVEQKFENVAGIKSTFLVGDGRAYNVLFIVPDKTDIVFSNVQFVENPRLYFSRIIDEANKTLAPYERVVNFMLLDRDFSLDKGELTPKGSFIRKNIENNFEQQIKELYVSNYITLASEEVKINIPRWFFRDLGVLLDEIIIENGFLKNTRNNKSIHFVRKDERKYIIGSLEYSFHKELPIDLGEFALQPFLWVGNPELVEFAPCKEGWDSPMENVSEQVLLPKERTTEYLNKSFQRVKSIKNERLAEINSVITTSLFSDDTSALEAVEIMSVWLEAGSLSNVRHSDLIKSRLESLAYHPNEDVRCLAYRILLLDSSTHDYIKHFPQFVESGLTFLNEESIEIISQTKLERRRLESLRKRLAIYRKTLTWPADELRRNQFEQVFQLLVNFVKHHTNYYSSVRAELSSWILHRKDPYLSRVAQEYFNELAEFYEKKLKTELPQLSKEQWDRILIFDDDFSPLEIDKIREVLIGTTFLEQSIILAFDQWDFNLTQIIEDGVWIMKIGGAAFNQLYRVSVNTKDKHFDLQIIVRDKLDTLRQIDTIFRLVSIAGYPFGVKVLPKLGCCRPELDARSMIYVNELTLWDKLREMASRQASGRYLPKKSDFRKLYIEGMTAVIRAWSYSNKTILPGLVSPSNVSVPEIDYMETSTIRSLAGWQEYTGPLDFLKTLCKNFFERAVMSYPRFKSFLQPEWIFDACMEALEPDSAYTFFDELKGELEKSDFLYFGKSMLQVLCDYVENRKSHYYQPINLLNAIQRYEDWEKLNTQATEQAKEDMIVELYRLYRLYRFPRIVRYDLFRQTYFKNLDIDASTAFDKLLMEMSKDLSKPATRLYELSELQSRLYSAANKQLFTRMVFPKSEVNQEIDFMKIGKREKEVVLLRSYLKDRYSEEFTFRESVEPAEIGWLFRIFLQEKYPKTISRNDRFYVVIDKTDRIIGGLCYKVISPTTILLDGTVISEAFKGRGIARSMLESFFDNMESQGVEVIKTHFYLRDFYGKLGFTVDKSWGAIVKFLKKE